MFEPPPLLRLLFFGRLGFIRLATPRILGCQELTGGDVVLIESGFSYAGVGGGFLGIMRRMNTGDMENARIKLFGLTSRSQKRIILKPVCSADEMKIVFFSLYFYFDSMNWIKFYSGGNLFRRKTHFLRHIVSLSYVHQRSQICDLWRKNLDVDEIRALSLTRF